MTETATEILERLTGFTPGAAAIRAALARETALRMLANELSWSPKTRDTSDRILAILAVKP